MTPMSFSEAEYRGKRKQTQRGIVLAEKVVPWEALLAQMGPFYPRAARGRHPYPQPMMMMLRV